MEEQCGSHGWNSNSSKVWRYLTILRNFLKIGWKMKEEICTQGQITKTVQKSMKITEAEEKCGSHGWNPNSSWYDGI